ALDKYLKIANLDNEDIDINIAAILLYESVHLINSEFIQVTLSYNNLLIFNNISIRMEEDQLEEFVTYNNACFAKNNRHKGLKLELI
ncbi:1559_t:CDS:2, partial [Funneliformis caledonium]